MSTHKTHPGDVELKFASKTLIVGLGKVEHPPKDGKANSHPKTLGKILSVHGSCHSFGHPRPKADSDTHGLLRRCTPCLHFKNWTRGTAGQNSDIQMHLKWYK